MAMRHGVLPQTLHVDEPTPHVDWSAGAVSLLTEPVPWPEHDRPRRAGVSSFGMSGTNAHLILEQAIPEQAIPEQAIPEHAPESPGEPEAAEPPATPGVVPLVLSARGVPALRAQAAALRQYLSDHPGAPLAGIGSALLDRAALPERGVVVAAGIADALAGLEGLATGLPTPGAVVGTAGPGAPRPVFVFPGQGSQWTGMAAELLAASPVFAAEIDACEQAFTPFVDWSLAAVLRAEPGAPTLERVDVVQPVLFAVMVSLAALWRSYGVEPAAVVGHSQGEIAAAYVAGGLSLADAARVVTLRARALVELAGHGGMAAVAAARSVVEELVARWPGRLAIASVNGPASTVVSGDPAAVEEMTAVGEAAGIRVRPIDVDYASHSPHVEAIEDRLAELLAPIEPRTGDVPFYSTVTGAPLDTARLDGGYWYTNLRQTVNFEGAVRSLLTDGFRLFVESSAHPVLTYGLAETIEAVGVEAAAVGSLRRDDGGAARFALSVAEVAVRGLPVDWVGGLGGDRDAWTAGRPDDLPTYPFQHRRFWIEPAPGPGDVAAAGLRGTDHLLLGAAVSLAESGGLLLTGRLSRTTHPWLVDHVVFGEVLVPGTAFVELAARAGIEAGAELIEELTVLAPLSLPAEGDVAIQVEVRAPDGAGRRVIHVHSRPAGARSDAEPETAWTRHADGVLAPADLDVPPPTSASWPPAGARPVDVEALYDRLAAVGLDYGPSFRNVARAWRHAGDLLAEIALPAEMTRDAEGFGLHPALLDAALHGMGAGGFFGDTEAGLGQARLPFSWRGVRLSGRATTLRVRLSPAGPEALALTAEDEAGRRVATVESLVARPATAEQLHAALGGHPLYRVDWTPVVAPPVPVPGPGSWAVVGPGSRAFADRLRATVGIDAATFDDPAALGAAIVAGDTTAQVVLAPVTSGAGPGGEAAPGVPSAARGSTVQAMGWVQAWAADDRLAGSTLVVVTHEAVLAESPDLAQAPVWGLIRSAQQEHPGRFVLADLERVGVGAIAALAFLPAALASGEEQMAVRGAEIFAPRLARGPGDRPGGRRPLDPAGTVLITGATGTLGGLVARHLAARHGARHLLLVGRRGRDAAGMKDLVADLETAGAEVTVAPVDVADRDELAGLLASIPPDRPLTGVVHAAGVLDDAVLTALDPGQVDRVFAPKVDAAWYLHELTRGRDLALFALFSSATATFGAAGQANYAAANAFLDALATRRRADGEAAVSLAWGLWEQASGMTGQMSDLDRARLARSGLGAALPSELGLELFDAALERGEPVVVPVRLDLPALRSGADQVPPLLRDLARGARRRGAGSGSGRAAGADLPRRLEGLSASERRRAVLEAVRTQAAAALGHADPGAVPAGAAFKDLGFDSLTGVELRNRLDAITGLHLPATLVFDHPTSQVLAAYLLAEHFPDAPARDDPARDDPARDDPARDDPAPAGAAGPTDDEIRTLLDSLSPRRVRAAGLVEALRDIARTVDAGGEPDGGEPDGGEPDGGELGDLSGFDDLDSLDAESLVRMAMDDADS
jgi:acyl transferase domain-containing protein